MYIRFPSGVLHMIHPVSCITTWARNPPRAFPMRRVTTQVSNPNSRTACTMALKKKRDHRRDAPSLLRMRAIFLHTTLVRDKFLTTANQSLSAAEITRTRYLKEVTISRGRP